MDANKGVRTWAISLAARMTWSPVVVTSQRAAPPTSPQHAGPVATPMAHPGKAAESRRAAWQPRTAWSVHGVGDGGGACFGLSAVNCINRENVITHTPLN